MRILLTGALLLLTVAQGGVLVHRMLDAPSSVNPRPFRMGDTLTFLNGRMNGANSTLRIQRPDGQWTALLTFASDCIHCQAVAPAWHEWLTDHHDLNVTVIAVTKDTQQIGSQFLSEYDIRVPLLSIAANDEVARAFVSRTPWLFLFDADAVLRYEGHGSTVFAVDSLVSALSVKAAQSSTQLTGSI